MRGALLFSIALVGVGCGKKSEDAKPAASGSGSAVAAPGEPGVVPESDIPNAPGTTASGINLSKLPATLAEQKAHRGVGPSTDAVFTEVEKLGLKIDKRQQLVANSSGANYCENIHTGELVVVVCEYDSNEAAVKAKAKIDSAWAQLNGSLVRTVHKGSMLTVVHGGKPTPDVDRIVTAFNAL